MTALELYQFIQENNIEWKRFPISSEQQVEDVLIFLNPFEIESFCKMFTAIDEEITDCFTFHFNGEYFAIYMADICEYYEIDMKQVFKQPNQ